jgi:hypothetical protein
MKSLQRFGNLFSQEQIDKAFRTVESLEKKAFRTDRSG